jgi:hypothetical protein
MLEELEIYTEAVRELARSFEPGLYSGTDASSIYVAAGALERSAAAIKSRAAGRVEESRIHERSGHRSAGELLAEQSGEPISGALSALEANRAANRHPAIGEALDSGELSFAQTKQIASAADRDPEEAQRLADEAKSSSFSDLRQSCEKVKVSSYSAEDEIRRYERIRGGRYVRTWVDHDGSGRMDARLTPDGLAIVKGAIEGLLPELEEFARAEGRTESRRSLMADALVAIANQASSGRSDAAGPGGTESSNEHTGGLRRSDPTGKNGRILLRIRVDLQAFLRGHASSGEICEIPGLGSIPVVLARDVLSDALLQLVIEDGVDVRTCVTDSRHISAALRVALEERDPTCCVPGCNATEGLEFHHFGTEFAKGGPTSLTNVARVCTHHHSLVTHKGWTLSGEPGNWRFDPPGTGPPGSGRGSDSAEQAPGHPVGSTLF